MKTDSLFYRLFQTFPPLLFDLLGVTLPAANTYRFQSVELKQTAFRLDGLFSPPETYIHSPLFFVEVQFQPDDAFYQRFFCELFLYLRQFDPPNPWQAVVLYPNRTVDTGKTFHYQDLLASPRVTRLYLDELEQPENASLSFRLVKLVTTPLSEAIPLAQQIVEQTSRETIQRQHYSLAQVKNREFMGPDVFAVVGVPKGERKSWVVWEEGKGPDVVIELLSESTAEYDKTEKKRLYEVQLLLRESQMRIVACREWMSDQEASWNTWGVFFIGR